MASGNKQIRFYRDQWWWSGSDQHIDTVFIFILILSCSNFEKNRYVTKRKIKIFF